MNRQKTHALTFLIVVIVCVILGYKLSVWIYRRNACSECNIAGSECGGFENTSKNTLLPILDPWFNLRECTKQIILLEDHLFNPRKRCSDCIRKHMLTIEGLGEEATTLDKQQECEGLGTEIAESMRDIMRSWKQGENPAVIAQKLRSIRKPLMAKCADDVQ